MKNGSSLPKVNPSPYMRENSGMHQANLVNQNSSQHMSDEARLTKSIADKLLTRLNGQKRY